MAQNTLIGISGGIAAYKIPHLVRLLKKQGDNVRIAIEAPREVKIYRGEIYRAIQDENKRAAAPADIDLSGALPGTE